MPDWLVDQRLRQAITEKRSIELSYKRGPLRILEPHDYGIQHGVERLFAFQVGGFSKSGPPHGWRMLDLVDISDLVVLDRTFVGSRDADQRHRVWDTLFARVT